MRDVDNRLVRAELPTGTVTFLFTDIEGSTRLVRQLGDEKYAEVLAEHRHVLREVWRRHNGVEVDTQGDAFFVAFARASDAVAAAHEAQLTLANGPVRARMGLHAGEAVLGDEGYVGFDVHRAARIAAVGHGGQVLLSQTVADLAGVEVRDLGLRRLKDLSSPERLYQLGSAEFPPLRTLRDTNLPAPETPFVGREHDTKRIAELLARTDVRLVTLTGAGGSGKTRLALQSAAEAADNYDSGVWWVPLASLSNPADVETAASQALGSKETLDVAIGDHRLLLVLDNFEHLLEAAPVVARTIASCPHLTVLVTSREPLHVNGEWEVAIDPMQETEAVELFVQRAIAVKSDFSPDAHVPAICARLDYLPLAIELAAARVKAISTGAILDRLEHRLPLLAGGSRSAPERQRTLRSAISWSFDLLESHEQMLFARLAVFAGGCTLDAADEVCGADLDAIASLVDKSLLRRTDERYTMLETIREFANERLEELDDTDHLRDRHAAYFLSLVELAAPELRGRDAGKWLERIDGDHANVRAALDHLLETRDADRALRLSGSAWMYWQTRGNWTEGRRYLAAAIELGEGVESERLVGPLHGSAILAIWQGDDREGERLANRILEISRTVSDQERERVYSLAIHLLAIVASKRGDRAKALALMKESLELSRRAGDSFLLAVALNNLGDEYMRQGDHARAIELFEESLAIGEARGDLDRRARALTNLAMATHALGDLARARELNQRGLQAATEIGLVEAQMWALMGIGVVEVEVGDARIGARLLGRTKELAVQLGAANELDEYLSGYQAMPKLEAALGREQLGAELSVGGSLSIDEAIDLALSRN